MRPLPWLKVKKVRQSFSTAPQFSQRPLACGKVEDPDADDREDDQSGYPDVTRDVVVLDLARG